MGQDLLSLLNKLIRFLYTILLSGHLEQIPSRLRDSGSVPLLPLFWGVFLTEWKVTRPRYWRLIYYSGLTISVVLNVSIYSFVSLLALAGPYIGVDHLSLDIHARIVK